jgi:hypothetical protein
MNNEATKFSAKSIRAAVGLVDSIGRNKAGHIIVRRGFFYTNGKGIEHFRAYVVGELEHAGIAAEVVDSGEHRAAFRGGASTAQGSHWWVALRAAGVQS